MTNQEAFTKLAELDQHLHALNHAMSVLMFDGETIAPRRSVNGRGETIGYLSGLYFDTLTDKANEEIFQTVLSATEASDIQRRQAEELKQQYDEIARMPADEYVSWQKMLNEANSVWHEAKEKSDFAAFAPYLEQVITYNRRIAELKDNTRPVYDVLLANYEKGLTRAQLDPFFDLLRKELTPLILEIQQKPEPRTDFLHDVYPVNGQRLFSDKLMALMGIDRSRCAISETEHPFTDNNNRDDVRITTHYFERDVASNLFSVIHEGGHALYEMGVSPSLDGTCLSGGNSMALHESQSRFYENIIGRSEAFCQVLLPMMQESFPKQMKGVTARELYQAVNLAKPSLIRTEADELTYAMHIVVRYELEKAMIDGSLSIKDVPGEWNRMYKEYLGVDVPDDRRGCLQDTHWSGGSIGYFPTYALGSAYGAQMLEKMKQDMDPYALVAQGKIQPITDWLAAHIHQYGKLLYPTQVFEKACGAPFDPHFFVRYLKNKYTDLYQLGK